MPMPPYPVMCQRACGRPAEYKIAARWSDGSTQELKTYALACPVCLQELYQIAKTKQRACKLSLGETLDAPGVYDLTRGSRDRQLTRRPELEGLS